jgi:hypothetical protein
MTADERLTRLENALEAFILYERDPDTLESNLTTAHYGRILREFLEAIRLERTGRSVT